MKTQTKLNIISSAIAFLVLVAVNGRALSANLSPSAAAEDGIGLAPARFELSIPPGTERTVVVNVIYNAGSDEAQPCRLVASLGDWSISNDGDLQYYKGGTQHNSACAWLTYSPVELTAVPGRIHPIRVTISVPKDASPGDHLAALFVESRPDNLKLDENRRQLVLRFRMAALFYIMVPKLTRRGSLEDLKSGLSEDGIMIVPTLRNEGNSHLRPVHSAKIVDASGAIVAELPESESLPVLGGCALTRPLLIEAALRPGSYTVRYSVDFKDGNPIIEGQTALVVKRRPTQSTK